MKVKTRADHSVPQLFDIGEIEILRKERLHRESPPPAEVRHPLPLIEERFPRIARAIADTWGTRECDAYLSRLIVDERGSRAGFPPDVLRALLDLSQQHQRQFGFAPDDNVWIDDPLSPSRKR